MTLLIRIIKETCFQLTYCTERTLTGGPNDGKMIKSPLFSKISCHIAYLNVYMFWG